MFDIGWSELLLIGIVALIVVGPKDLPRMFHALGRFTGKARGMAREFQRAMDDAAKETGVREATDEMKKMVGKKSLGIDRLEDAAKKFEKWDPAKRPATPKAAAAAPGSETAKLAETRAAEAAARAEAAKPAPAAAPASSGPAPEAPAASAPKSGTGDA